MQSKAECSMKQENKIQKIFRRGNIHALESPEIKIIFYGWQFCIWQLDVLLKIIAHEGLKITPFACYCLNIRIRKKVEREIQRFKLYLRITNKLNVLFYLLLFYFFQLLLSFCLYNKKKINCTLSKGTSFYKSHRFQNTLPNQNYLMYLLAQLCFQS